MMIVGMVAAMPMALATTNGNSVPGMPGMPCAGNGIYTPASNMPLYVTALQDVNELIDEVHAQMADMEDTTEWEEQLEAVNEKIAAASEGTNYVNKKDLMMEAKAMLEALLNE
ncbi:hypothetical protein EF808_06850 [archaeon]|nr:MAG: hypothetical protein EF808_06850 [archaeon]